MATLLLTTIAPPLRAAEPIRLAVDATEAPSRRLHVREVVPVTPGGISLAYPRWIPGEHGPTGPITDVAGIHLRAAGRDLAWRRDDVDMYRIRAQVPAGTREVELSFDFLGYAGTQGFSAAASLTEQLALLSWNELVFYPGGARSDSVPVSASLTLPAGWQFATALPVRHAVGAHADFETVSLTTLVDSPVLTGRWFRTVDLTPKGGPPAFLHMAADGPDALAMDEAQVVSYRALMRESEALFGGHHYRSYHFLVSMSDHIAHFGLEHHESSDDRVVERAWVDADERASHSNLLSHELVHSWNGKFRRPSGLATGDFQTPMRGELLWVYEGLTQYLGFVLSGRSGVRTPAQAQANLALQAAYLDHQPGRTWRPLEDTAVEAQILYEAPSEGEGWRRSTDFYDEGLLMWLEADVKIRQLTGGRRSLDDFCHRFHGAPSGPPRVVPYTYDDVIRTLNEVAPSDWNAFFDQHLHSLSPRAPMAGIENGGWHVVYADSATPFFQSLQDANENIDEWFSAGIRVIKKDGEIQDVLPGSPAAKAGVAPGDLLVAVDGRAWSKDVLHDAVRATAHGRPLELLVKRGEFYSAHRLDYKAGAQYPRLRRDPVTHDWLSEILAPKAGAAR